MRSSRPPDDLGVIAAALCPEPVERISELSRGNNSRIFRVDTRVARYALKRYPATDDRNRLAAEVAALRFFERRGIPRTPAVVAVAPETRHALYTWIEGDPLRDVSDADVAQFAAFQIALDRAIDPRARREIGEASQACLSGRRIAAQVERRCAELATVKHDIPGFASFLDDMLVPSLGRFEARARAAYGRLGLDFDAEIAAGRRTLIPSDLGAHNALRGRDGRLFFLDFEYFGWDDPLTSIANFVMHPGMALSPAQQAHYRQALLGHFRRPAEAERLAALMPLYGLRWCAILLGELLPERWRHRMESNPERGDWANARRRQIDKARALLASIEA